MCSAFPRQGTAAAHFSDPVDSRVRQARVHALMALGETLKQRYAQRFIGQTLPVLFEGARALSETLSVVQGYTPNYLKVALKTTRARTGAEFQGSSDHADDALGGDGRH